VKTKRKVAGKNWEFDGTTITVRIPMTGNGTVAER
jgi:hypothetical protein